MVLGGVVEEIERSNFLAMAVPMPYALAEHLTETE
jgi:hypothetical protein